MAKLQGSLMSFPNDCSEMVRVGNGQDSEKLGSKMFCRIPCKISFSLILSKCTFVSLQS